MYRNFKTTAYLNYKCISVFPVTVNQLNLDVQKVCISKKTTTNGVSMLTVNMLNKAPPQKNKNNNTDLTY